VTGRDVRGRKQYRYHSLWNQQRSAEKFARAARFLRLLPQLRRQIASDLSRPGVPRDKVLALMLKLIELTMLRVGNDQYARTNGSYGITTLTPRHVSTRGNSVRFRFPGKSGVEHQAEIVDGRIAKLVRQCRLLSGRDVFAYVDSSNMVRDVRSCDVNEYLRTVAGDDFTAKDFRTAIATRLAYRELCHHATEKSLARRKRILRQVISRVAGRLGNTAAVCRGSYIHPAIYEAFLAGKWPGSHARSGSATTKTNDSRLLALLAKSPH
jgi:DNA topoisomerase-1